MDESEITTALRRLGELGVEGRFILAGSAAAILGDWLSRATMDVDVIVSEPKPSEISKQVQEVSEEMGLPADWLNDAATAWRDYLPSDFLGRIERIATFGDLGVFRLARQDLVLLKLIGLRPQDLEDLREMEPTEEELRFAKGQLERIAVMDPAAALRVELYLNQAGLGTNGE